MSEESSLLYTKDRTPSFCPLCPAFSAYIPLHVRIKLVPSTFLSVIGEFTLGANVSGICRLLIPLFVVGRVCCRGLVRGWDESDRVCVLVAGWSTHSNTLVFVPSITSSPPSPRQNTGHHRFCPHCLFHAANLRSRSRVAVPLPFAVHINFPCAETHKHTRARFHYGAGDL